MSCTLYMYDTDFEFCLETCQLMLEINYSNFQHIDYCNCKPVIFFQFFEFHCLQLYSLMLYTDILIMVALCNRETIYIFIL